MKHAQQCFWSCVRPVQRHQRFSLPESVSLAKEKSLSSIHTTTLLVFVVHSCVQNLDQGPPTTECASAQVSWLRTGPAPAGIILNQTLAPPLMCVVIPGRMKAALPDCSAHTPR